MSSHARISLTRVLRYIHWEPQTDRSNFLVYHLLLLRAAALREDRQFFHGLFKAKFSLVFSHVSKFLACLTAKNASIYDLSGKYSPFIITTNTMKKSPAALVAYITFLMLHAAAPFSGFQRRLGVLQEYSCSHVIVLHVSGRCSV